MNVNLIEVFVRRDARGGVRTAVRQLCKDWFASVRRAQNAAPPAIWNYPDDPLTLPRADFDAAYPDRDDPPIDASRHFRTIVSHLCGCRHPICAAARSVEVERASFFSVYARL